MIDIMSYIKYIYCVLNFIMKLYKKNFINSNNSWKTLEKTERERECVCQR